MSNIERFYVSGCGNHDCDPLELCTDGDYVRFDDYEKLKADNESLREQLEDADEQVVALEKKVKALIRDHDPMRKDAERYQFLKLDASHDGSLIERLDCNIHPSGWDRAIDAALSS